MLCRDRRLWNRAETTSRFFWGTVSADSFNAKPQAPAQVKAPNFNERGRRVRLAVNEAGTCFGPDPLENSDDAACDS
jgi:hypothetical protein